MCSTSGIYHKQLWPLKEELDCNYDKQNISVVIYNSVNQVTMTIKKKKKILSYKIKFFIFIGLLLSVV